jgi:tetratricopeptide (TPR) repeat protein
MAEAYYHLAWTQSVLGQIDKALENYRKASELSPGMADAIGGEASIYVTKGEYQTAYDRIRPLIEKGVVSVQIAIVFADLCSKLSLCDKAIEYANKTLSSPDITYDSRIALRHIVGKLYDACGEFDKAFEEYRKANSMQPGGYESCKQEKYVDDLIEIWSERFLSRFPVARHKVALPIFIVGMPRSGTTLLEQILAAHPDVHGGGELPYMQKLLLELPGLLDSAQSYPRCVSNGLDQALVDRLAEDYVTQLRQLSEGAKRITDKMWVNYEHLALISRLFPAAKIIHCLRDPLDTCLSIYFQYFSGRVPFSNDLKHIGQYYRSYMKLMKHWQRVLGIELLEVRYEHLVAQQEAVTRSIIDFCGLPWDSRCLEFHRSHRVTRTVSQEQVHRPMYQTSVNRWKNYERHIATLKETLEDEVQ